jgi:hypothetical protein
MATSNTPLTTPAEPFTNGDELLPTRKLDTICLFDVDGTITMARQVITKNDLTIEIIFDYS